MVMDLAGLIVDLAGLIVDTAISLSPPSVLPMEHSPLGGCFYTLQRKAHVLGKQLLCADIPLSYKSENSQDG